MKTRLGMCALLALSVLAAPVLFAADVQEQVDKYFELAKDEKTADAAKPIGEGILKDADKDANQLNEFAWKLLTEEGVKKRDMDLAMRVAKAAFDACDGKEAAIVDTYAKALFDTGKRAEGLAFQKKAVELCTDDNLKTELEATLKNYEEKIKEAPVAPPASLGPPEKKADEKK